MLYCRFKAGEVEGYGVVEQHQIWEISPHYFAPWEKTGRAFAMDDVQLLVPSKPSKIIAVGLNYKDHIEEFGRTRIPEEPVIFLKAVSAAIAFNEKIVLPRQVGAVDYEAEMGVVIGKQGWHISEDQVSDHILGLTCINDVTARELQKRDGQWARAKSFDTFAPIGPWIADGLPYNQLRIEAYLNGKVVQESHTSQMIFSVPHIVSFVSRVMTLYPGDIISTGTPRGVGPLNAGDIIEVFVEGVGRLRNPVISER